ncbi:MAG: chloride channel protein [Phycisphaerae bacterium]|nr:chloride channel protein [Phycisphaerae bacterium]
MTNSKEVNQELDRFRWRTLRIAARLGLNHDSILIFMAILIGVFTALGSVGFTKLIELAHNFCYGHGGHEGVYRGHWYFLFLLPAGGALLVGLITYYFAREAKGHGVPEVMDAIARKESKIRPRVAVAKAIASALTIGSGGSAGTEGPIIQIGAALGSSLGGGFRVSKMNMPVMVGCGAAAGISAIFHAPIAGVLFAQEVFLRDISFKTFSPVLIASVISSIVVRMMLGDNAIFPILNPELVVFNWFELGNYVVLGIFCAIAALLFIKALYATEDFFDWLKIHHVLKPVIGALGLGVLGIVTVYLMRDGGAGEPALYANGYPIIGRCIGAALSADPLAIKLTIGTLLILAVLKILATCCTLGSGGSGGVFAPSMFLGAVVGYAFGLFLQQSGIYPQISPFTYALVGMASVVAATTHAPMAAIIILFEMTRSYQVILPVMFSATIALGIARLLYRDSIYTLKLRRRGVHYESRAHKAVLSQMDVRQVMRSDYVTIEEDLSLQEVIKMAIGKEVADFIVVDHTGKYQGLLVAEDLREALLQPESVPFLVAGELVRTDVPTVLPDETLDTVLNKFSSLMVSSMPIRSPQENGEYLGMVTRTDLMRHYHQRLEGDI